MNERPISPLNSGQVQLARRYQDLLVSLDEDYPEPFKSRDVTARFEDISNGDLLRLKFAGLLVNEAVATDKPKDWFLSRKTKRWLRTR